eukprot:4924938-Amphidinium_carterae.1
MPLNQLVQQQSVHACAADVMSAARMAGSKGSKGQRMKSQIKEKVDPRAGQQNEAEVEEKVDPRAVQRKQAKGEEKIDARGVELNVELCAADMCRLGAAKRGRLPAAVQTALSKVHGLSIARSGRDWLFMHCEAKSIMMQ